MHKTISIWRFVISLGLAKTGTWCTTDDHEKRTYLISIHFLSSSKYKNCKPALAIIIFPFSFVIGYSG